jgi:carbamoyltransferase
MNVIGISGVHNNVSFKKKEFPNLSPREYRIAQGFDSAAALVGPEGVMAAAAEERFTREKATGNFPVNAIQYCLRAGKVSPQDVDYIAHGFAYEPFKDYFQAQEFTQRQYQELYSPEAQKRHIEQYFPSFNWKEKFIAVPHHLAHAASAFYPSGFGESLILVSDGMGEMHSMTVAVGQGADIRVLQQVPALHSLGIFYGVFTLYLGFYMGLDEYKVMGLAPYGNPRRFFERIMEFVKLKNDGTYSIPLFASDQTVVERETHAGVLRVLAGQFGPSREPEAEITQDHKDIAAALQAVVQTCQLEVLRHFRRETNQTNLCLAGGVALNCSANGVIKRSRLFRQMFVQPAAGDDGSALGAALYASRLKDSGFKRQKMTVPLWGPEYSGEEIQRLLAGRNDCHASKAKSCESLCEDIAARIEKGQIVAWFQGRMEFGPRALGSRSILADPRDPTMRDRINSLVKKREGFRPFAPIVTKEGASRFFDIISGDEETYAHMLFVMQVRPPFRERLPAVTHVDGSARVQTVSSEHTPLLWQLLNEFEKVSGLPILLNTSFNVRGQPIVRTPEEALDTFLLANLDALVIGDYTVIPKRPEIAERTLINQAAG